MVASRTVDREDIVSILAKNRDTIDLKYIENWLSEFGKIPEYEGISERFNRLLEKRSLTIVIVLLSCTLGFQVQSWDDPDSVQGV